MPEIVIIAAVAQNGVIGKDNQLLWHIPEDMKHFREVTAGKPVIMGRKTWESLPERFRPLPGRRNIVITRQAAFQASGAELASSLEHALLHCQNERCVFVIGGAEIYTQALPLADRLLLTEVTLSPAGDAWFPGLDHAIWQETSRTDIKRAVPPDCSFVEYRRRASCN